MTTLHRLLLPIIILWCEVTDCLQLRPLSGPRNYPATPGQPQQKPSGSSQKRGGSSSAKPAPKKSSDSKKKNGNKSETSKKKDGKPRQNLIGFWPPPPLDTPLSMSTQFKKPKESVYESAFPVFNVRYAYSPTALDARRRVALAQRQAEVIDNSAILESRIMNDFSLLMKHLDLQEQIIDLFDRIPWSNRNVIQDTLLRRLAKGIPEVSRSSSFLEENPQINIAVEDNSADFDGGSDPDAIRPKEALVRLQDVQKIETRNRGKIFEILKINVKIFSLLLEYLKTPMMLAAAAAPVVKRRPVSSSFFQQTPISTPVMNSSSLLTPPPTPQPGWYSDKNASNGTSPGAIPGSSGLAIGIDMPFFMKIRARVMEGGAQGAKALASLIDLWNDQEGARESIRRSMVGMDCKMLMMSPKTSDYVKNLAGSLLTLMSGIPAGSSVPDFTSGSYGHVNVIVPRPSRVYAADKEIALLEDTGP